MKKHLYYHASDNPVSDIEQITYTGQNPKLRMYKEGYESYFNIMPVIENNDEFKGAKVDHSKKVMQQLAARLVNEPWMYHENIPGENDFARTILALERPKNINGKLTEGSEIVVARWGDGFTSPVHGHATGYIHEDIIYGKMRVNTYRMVEPNSKKVRLIRTDIYGPGTVVSMFADKDDTHTFKRQTLIHNFTSIGNSASLHYLPEHTRDGRDNKFEVEYFEDVYWFTSKDVRRITSFDGMYLQPGDVVLVRSQNVPEYGDHYIVITGHPVMKEHGMRVQEVAISTPYNWLLNEHDPHQGLILLKLTKHAQQAFHRFHGITMVDKKVTFPKP